MRFLIFTTLFFIITFQVRAEDSAVSCEQEYDGVALDKPELLQLFREIKNGVLGTVPKFCRKDNATKQLQEQVNSEEDQLSKFVDALKKSKDLGSDVVLLIGDSKVDNESLILQNLKMMVLKKMWNNSTDEQRFKILISRECYSLKLNKYPANDEGSKKLSDEEKALALKNNLSVCQASKFSDIAPYLTNDILAEALANIKTIAPQNFDLLVDNLCESLKKSDELIFKEDIYSKMGMGKKESDGSSKKFSAWLKLLLKDDIKAKREAQAQADAYQKSLKEAKVKLLQQYAEAYEKGQVPGEPAKEIPFKDTGKVIIKKNGQYFLTWSSETWEKMKVNDMAFAESGKKYAIQNAQGDIANQKKAMLNFYTKGQVEGEPEKPVPVPNFPGYFLVKGEDGSIYYSLDPKLHGEVNEKLKDYFAKMDAKKTAEASLDYMQSSYKSQYEQQQGMPDWKLQNLDFTIVLKEDGTYVPVPAKKAGDPKASYQSALVLNGANIPIPMFNWAGTSIVQTMTNNDGIYSNVSLQSFTIKDGYKVPPAPVSPYSYQAKSRSFNLDDHIDGNYQKRNYDSSKKASLTADEIDAIETYTGSGYIEINRCLRNDSCSNDDKKVVANLESGLKKIRTAPKKTDSFIVYRGTALPPEILDKLNKEPKKFQLDKGFMSTSGNVGISYGFSGAMIGAPVTGVSAMFIIKSKNCVGISNISTHTSEDEFLCPPGMKFNVKKQDPDSNVFILEDVD